MKKELDKMDVQINDNKIMIKKQEDLNNELNKKTANLNW